MNFKRISAGEAVGIAVVALVLVAAAWGVVTRAQSLPEGFQPQAFGPAGPTAIPTGTSSPRLGIEDLPPFAPQNSADGALVRDAEIHTTIPNRPRMGLLTYQVQGGDTLFDIAEEFSIKPESVLWGNWYALDGDPHLLKQGQELKILPVDGTLHQWSAGEGLNGIADFYGVTAQDIIDWPGNNLAQTLDPADPGIEDGAELIIPGGRREAPSWQQIRITRANPAVASILGPGACGAVSNGPTGDGFFGWPTPGRTISGYGYLPGIHEAVDIGGGTGNAIYAADDGVVVYSGWNNWGYGYVIVLDHGNGWQTLYAHLSATTFGCGQAAFQGNVIGGMGCTGNCSGTHLHFEMRNDLFGRVNPMLYLP
jgi:murein DD-endopeptidase MepM/ murein hydrolase activator NlpD